MDGTAPDDPDGLPLIGRLPGHPRVLLATGHNMLGLMLAPATARLVTGLLVGGTSSGPAAAFDPARDARLHRTGRLHRKGRSLSPPVIYPEPLKSAGVR